MSNRSKQLAQEFKAQQETVELARKEKLEAEQIKNKKALLDAKTLEQEAPKIWAKLCSMFVKQCEELNAEPGMENTLLLNPQNNDQIIVARVGEEKPSVRISFGRNDYSIRFGGLYQPSSMLRIKILNGDSEPSVVTEDGKVVDLENIVDGCLRGLLGL